MEMIRLASVDLAIRWTYRWQSDAERIDREFMQADLAIRWTYRWQSWCSITSEWLFLSISLMLNLGSYVRTRT